MIYPYGCGIYDIFGQYNKHLDPQCMIFEGPPMYGRIHGESMGQL